MAFEIEAKYAIADLTAFRGQLRDLGARPVGFPEEHTDTYFAHPCRSFVETKEALRVRRIDGIPFVTYKGPKLPGAIKARRELEWNLSPGDSDGGKMIELLLALGFQQVAEVRKRRQNYELETAPGSLGMTVDEVEGVGNYAEIEAMAADESGVSDARQRISRVADRLDVDAPETRSYLTLLLDRLNKDLCEKD